MWRDQPPASDQAIALERRSFFIAAFPDADRGRGVRLLALWDAPFDNAKELPMPMPVRVAAVVVVFVLLVGAGALALEPAADSRGEPGLQDRRRDANRLNMFAAGYDTLRARIVEDQALARIRAMSGVQSAAFQARSTPFTTAARTTRVQSRSMAVRADAE